MLARQAQLARQARLAGQPQRARPARRNPICGGQAGLASEFPGESHFKPRGVAKVKKMLQKIDETSLIKFSPKEIKYKIYVFTDVDCGFCRKFHNQIASYLDEGIQVNYLAFPRSGTESETYKKMSIAWCSVNKQEVLTGLKEDKSFEQIDCEDNPIKTHFELAKSIEIQGTPTIISQSGFTIPGYIEAKELIKYLK